MFKRLRIPRRLSPIQFTSPDAIKLDSLVFSRVGRNVNLA